VKLEASPHRCCEVDQISRENGNKLFKQS